MKHSSIADYIKDAPKSVQPTLRRIRSTIRAAAPQAEETISYRMPAFRQGGILVYFAAFKHHVGVFPPVRGNAALEKAVARFAGPKGNLKFPLDKPMPYALISRIVKFRLKQANQKGRARA